MSSSTPSADSAASAPDAAPRGAFRRRVVDPLVALLKQGATPERLAMSLAAGALIGVFPVLGTTTALCFAAAFAFRLNVAAMQVANYVVYPLQLALIIPFIRLGERVFSAEPLPLSLAQLVELFRGGVFHAIGVVWRSLTYGAAAWALAAPLAAALLYAALLPVVRRLSAAIAAARGRAVPA